MRTRARVSLPSLAASPARSLRADDRNQRAKRERNPSTANSLARDLVASLRTVQVPGSPATYANRVYLRGLGLR